MDIMQGSVGFVVSAICAGLMGFAIQRGATCTVAAVDECLTRRRANRLTAMVEASLWVAGGLVVVQACGLSMPMPAAYEASTLTLVGSALLGVGALVNGACVFGTIARFGSGEWVYAASPIGFYAGCLTVDRLFAPAPHRLADPSPVLHAPGALALACALLMVVRLAAGALGSPRVNRSSTTPLAAARAMLRSIDSPHVATTAIGITFLITFLLAGAWGYTDALADVARDMPHDLASRIVLLAALLAGACVGGVRGERFRNTPITVSRSLQCFCGGLLMGWGSLLIPGSNDGLILVGMPLLRPYAWIAFATMCVAIAASMVLRDRIVAWWRRVTHRVTDPA